MIEAHRDELNARFARAAGARAPREALGYLRRTVVPLLDAWEGTPSAAVLFALFDIGLAGLRAGLVGETDTTAFERALFEHMPRLRTQVEVAPALVLRAIGNGYLHITRECGGERAAAWFDALAAGAPRCADRGALFDLGVVLGWRAGLAEARGVALERAADLDAALLAAIVGAAVDPAPARRFCQPGSTAPLGPLALVATTGGFVGFGGPFRRPPRPRVVAGHLVCTDGEVTSELFADVFGTRLRPAAWAHAEAIGSPDGPHATVETNATVDATGTVRVMGATFAAPELRGAVAAAACAGMVAVTLADSHQVFVLGRREAGA